MHRTFLNADGTKAQRADLGQAKKMLGPAKNAVIRLCADWTVAMGLGLSEGIENGVATIIGGFSPIWAATSAGNMASFFLCSPASTASP